MQRFYTPTLHFKGEALSIVDPRILHQTHKVLRMKEGAEFCLFDGNNESQVQVLEMGKKKMVVKKIQDIENDSEPRLKINLYQAVPKKPALFELIIQKATEIGTHAIYPLITKRTESRRLSKMERLNIIAMEATEQCGRIHIPKIHEPITFEKTVKNADINFIAYAKESNLYLSRHLSNVKNADEINLYIGPEGGFSEKEIQLALENDFKTFSLGKRILRTETAAIAALSLILLNA